MARGGSKRSGSPSKGKGPLARVFGVRHLSPAAGWHLQGFLAATAPTAVLVEGPADAAPLLPYLGAAGTVPPVALLAYTRPGRGETVRSVAWPFAVYSPEWVAVRAGLSSGCVVRFIDLPATTLLALESSGADGGSVAEKPMDLLANLARAAGEADHETWWERTFEHLTDGETFRAAMEAFGRELRGLEAGSPTRRRVSGLREAYMRREIRAVLAEGHDPARVVVVCGALHAPALVAEESAMTDAEARRLPKVDAAITLVPYSHRRMSAAEGYGAGTRAPAYLQALWETRVAGHPGRLAARYLTEVAARLRRAGRGRSSADVIEAVRLARALASLAGADTPALRDLRDAAETCMGDADPRWMRVHLAAVEVGDTVGAVTAEVPRSAIQEDFHQRVRALHLDRYLRDAEQTIHGSTQEGWLNLRENRFVKTVEAAVRDLQRSIFLHRLDVLDVGFARRGEPPGERAQGTFKEVWVARWTPDCELKLVELAPCGDTVELAAAERLGEHLAAATDLAKTAALARRGRLCDLPAVVATARARLQRLAVEDTSFAAVATAARELADMVRLPDVRRLDVAPFKPLVGQLYLRAVLVLPGAARCADDAARGVAAGMDALDAVTTYEDWGEEAVPAQRWYTALRGVVDDPTAHANLAGTACALLVERGQMTDAALDAVVARWLSPGSEPAAAAGFFEGLASRNRDALLSREHLWRSLCGYVDGLDERGFRRAVVGLRRVFAGFAPAEVRAVTGVLARLWGTRSDEVARAVAAGVDAGELDALARDLGDLGELDL